ncbi:kinase family protein [Salix suchowensis]|nr:kinase family protein [Salix suchowensis]
MEKVQGRGILGLVFLIIVFLSVSSGEAQSRSVLVNCGANSSVHVDGRRWIGDLAPNDNFTVSSPVIAASNSAADSDSTLGPLYKTARIFNALNYTFAGMQGNHFLRLHFCPFPFENYNVNESSFSVVANGLKLMIEFNVPAEISDKNLHQQNSNSSSSSLSLVKEYILAVNDVLVVEFVSSRGSFGFINAIEVVPVVDTLFADSVSKVGGSNANFNEIQPNQDSDLWRKWEVDSSYMITADAGVGIRNTSNVTMHRTMIPRVMSNTEVLEKKFNMSWKFRVDPDFDYLIRLHFCELVYGRANQRIFRVYINNKTAADSFDVYVRAGGKNIAYHQDYFDTVFSNTNTLWIQLGPDTAAGASGTDALLNGLEIFKLSRSANLAYADRIDSAEKSGSHSKSWILWVEIGAGVASVLIIAITFACIFCFCKNRRKQKSDIKDNPPGWRPIAMHGAAASSIASTKGGVHSLNGSLAASARVGRRFTLSEIRAATNNFDDSLVIGVGGFGKVYSGKIEDGTLAAIKRSNPQSEQGLSEFETEIEMLSKLRHKHLVSLIGFCEEQNEMILVYEYMANGTLRSHLFGSDFPPLTWKQRLEACIGATRGLHYLHTGADRGIIHRDIKTTNILLDENFVAKMADFGLSKAGPAVDHTHVSTAVKGSFGYLDPEYYRRQQLTEKSDVYSLGVVLFEVVCSRPVINPSLPRDQINLAEWAMKWQRKKSLETIIDPRLRGNTCPESLKKFGEIAEKCIADEGKNRPTMGEVLWHLEYALQLHEAWMRANATETSITSSQALEDLEFRVAEVARRPPFALDEETDRPRNEG